MPKPGVSWNPKFLQPVVISFLVVEVIDFAFSVSGEFLALFYIEGKRVLLHSLFSILNEERAFYRLFGVAQADAKSACWQAV